MAEGPVLVTAPAGNVGKEVVRGLLARGIAVRAGVRDPERAQLPDGVERVRFDFDDPSTFSPALDGASGLFLLRPTQIARVRRTLVPVVGAAERAGVTLCVFLSVEGAEHQPWLPHRQVEKALERSDVPWTFLRANHFMQNMIGPYRDAILSGRLALPAGEGRVSFVDCADLGDVAAIAFADPPGHAGRAYALTGPQAVSLAELAAQLSSITGHAVRYEPVSPLRYLRELRSGGAPFVFAAILTGLHVGIRRGSAAGVDPTLAAVLDRPPHTVSDFITAHRELLTPPGQGSAKPPQ